MQSSKTAHAVEANISLQSQLQTSTQLLSRATELSLLLGDIQKHGLHLPGVLSSLQRVIPAQCVTLSRITGAENDSSMYTVSWQENQSPTLLQHTVDVADYRAFCAIPRVIGSALEELAPNEMEMGRLFWPTGTQSFVVLPVLFQGDMVAGLHVSSKQPKAFSSQDLAFVQMFSDGLAPLLAYYHLQESRQHLEAQQTLLSNVQADYEQQLADALRQQDELLGEFKLQKNELQTQYKQQQDELINQLNTAKQQMESAQKRLQAAQQEQQRLNQELQRYRNERSQLRELAQHFDTEAQRVLSAGEEMRLFLLQVYATAQATHGHVENLRQENQNILQHQAELVMNAASEMIPQARNIANHLESLQDPAMGQLQNRQLRAVRASIRSGKHLDRLLAQLNDYSRCTTGQIQLNPEPLDVPALAKEVHGQFLSHAHNKKQQIQLHLDKAPRFEGDPYATRQLVYALFEHAIDATPENGKVSLSLSQATSFPGGLAIHLSHDSEPLSQEDMEHLFVPFRRPDFDPDDDIPPGLSLALVQQFARVQQGRCVAEQIAGQLQFSLELPAKVSPVVPLMYAQPQATLGSLPTLPPNYQTSFTETYAFPLLPEFQVSAENWSSPSDFPDEDEIPMLIESLEEVEAVELTGDDMLDAPPENLSLPVPPSPTPSTSTLLQNLAKQQGIPSPLSLPSTLTPESPTFRQPLPPLSGVPPLPSSPATMPLKTPLAPPLTPMPTTVPPAPKISPSTPTLTPPAFRSPLPGPVTSTPPSVLKSPPPLAPLTPVEEKPLPPPPMALASLEEEEVVEASGLILEELHEESLHSTSPKIAEPARSPLSLLVNDEPVTPAIIQHHTPVNIIPGTLLCLAGHNDEPQDVIFEDFENSGFQLALAAMDPHILDNVTEDQRPTVLMLYSLRLGEDYHPLITHIEQQPSTATMPMLATHATGTHENNFQLYWRGFHTQALPESFWRNWLQKLAYHQHGAEYNLLSIGLDPHQFDVHPLMLFLGGSHYHHHAELNPAQGIQQLWKHPPHILLIQLETNQLEQWLPMLDEISRSARTQDIPLVLFCQQSLTEAMKQALHPLQYLYFQPHH